MDENGKLNGLDRFILRCMAEVLLSRTDPDDPHAACNVAAADAILEKVDASLREEQESADE